MRGNAGKEEKAALSVNGIGNSVKEQTLLLRLDFGALTPSSLEVFGQTHQASH